MIYVLDASALLAVSKGERGAEFRMDLINTKECVISGVNIIDFNQEQALACATLRPLTKFAGLSLGDRACLALAQLMQGCAVTADRAWLDVATVIQVEVQMIR
jgi:ribonuclease VapC